MITLTISDTLAEKLEQLARQRQRPVEEVIEMAVDHLAATQEASNADASGKLNEDRELRRKLYAIARDYWQHINDQKRLALSDAELDKQFWLIDHEGIPRLKSEQGSVTLPPDPLEALIGLVEDAPPDLSDSVRQAMDEVYQRKYDRSH